MNLVEVISVKNIKLLTEKLCVMMTNILMLHVGSIKEMKLRNLLRNRWITNLL